MTDSSKVLPNATKLTKLRETHVTSSFSLDPIDECPIVPPNKDFSDAYAGKYPIKISFHILLRHAYQQYRMKILRNEAIFHLIYFLSFILYTMLQSQAMERNQVIEGVKQIFEHSQFPSSPGSLAFTSFPLITNKAGFAQWLNNVVYPIVIRHISNNDPPQRVNLAGNQWMWGMQFQLYQVVPTECASNITRTTMPCFPAFSISKQLINENTINHQRNHTNEGRPYDGYFASYPAIGTITESVLLNNQVATVQDTLFRLESIIVNHPSTRAVVATSTFFNTNYNIQLVAKFAAEFPPSGGTLSSSSYNSAPIVLDNNVVHTVGVVSSMVCNVLCLFFIISCWFEVKHIQQLHNLVSAKRIQYWMLKWLVLDLVILYLSIQHIVYTFHRIDASDRAKSILSSSILTNELDNILSRYQDMQVYYAILLISLAVKCTKFMEVFPLFSSLVRTTRMSMGYMVYYLVFLLGYFFAAGVFVHMFFGANDPGFETVTKALHEIVVVPLRDHRFSSMEQSESDNRGWLLGVLVVAFLFSVSLFNSIWMSAWIIDGSEGQSNGQEVRSTESSFGWIAGELVNFVAHPKRQWRIWSNRQKSFMRRRKMMRKWIPRNTVFMRLSNWAMQHKVSSKHQVGFTQLRQALQGTTTRRKMQVSNSQVESLLWLCRDEWIPCHTPADAPTSHGERGSNLLIQEKKSDTAAVSMQSKLYEKFQIEKHAQDQQWQTCLHRVEQVEKLQQACFDTLQVIDSMLKDLNKPGVSRTA